MCTVTIENLTDDTVIEYTGTLKEMTQLFTTEQESFKREGWNCVYSEDVNECTNTMCQWQYTDGETVIISLA